MSPAIVWLGVLVLIVVVGLAAAKLVPRRSGGAPGEVAADEPLSEPTGASWDDREHDGPAEDRPGGPAAEVMDPDELVAPETEQTDPTDERGLG